MNNKLNWVQSQAERQEIARLRERAYKMTNKLNLPTDKTYYDFIGTDGESAGIACFDSRGAAQKTLDELKEGGVTLSHIVIADTTRAIQIINDRAERNYSFPMDEGDSFFTCNA
jgi:hypothetical protein